MNVRRLEFHRLEKPYNYSGDENGSRPAHVMKIDGKWWIHLEGEVYVVNEVEKGGKSSESLALGSYAEPYRSLVKEAARVGKATSYDMEAMKNGAQDNFAKVGRGHFRKFQPRR